MMTPQQALRLFVYADYALILVGLAAMVAAVGLGGYAILPTNKGRRGHTLRKSLISFLIFAVFWGTQASVTMAFFHDHFTPLLLVLFALPVAVMLAGLTASVVYATKAILRTTGVDRRRRLLKSLCGFVVFGVGAAPHTVAMLGPLLSAEDHGNRPGTLTRVGDPVPDFEVTTIDGTPFDTVDLRGRVIVLNFFATWCGPCQSELPHLQAIWNEFRVNGDFRLLAVGREETDGSVEAFQQARGFTFPLASDGDASVYRRFASQSIPRTYLISRQGIIVYQWTGAYEEEIFELKERIRRELARES